MIISADAEKELDKSQHPFQILKQTNKQTCKYFSIEYNTSLCRLALIKYLAMRIYLIWQMVI